ncbi:MAG: LuxR C-terminal-related transcriptional regulator [Tannerella sp.]|jgi:DNA-binding CsgD family transcriptional regulator|nr:LuxR C-terminal-related transcriptional regulator [Tannerella sp.]
MTLNGDGRNTELSLIEMVETLRKEYGRLMSSQVFNAADMDYGLLERHRPMLAQMARMCGSVVSIFDMCARRHVFTSCNFSDLFGRQTDVEEMEVRMHPDDVLHLWQHAVSAFRYALACRTDVADCKFIVEYRISNASGRYVRVIEQQSVLESDRAGNVWLVLSVLDLSPDQSPLKAVKFGVFRKKDSSAVSIPGLPAGNMAGLSPREIEILQMVGDGMLSKEISDRLYISVHTVNTHRQRILEKLNVDNSMEAVKYASALGLLK